MLRNKKKNKNRVINIVLVLLLLFVILITILVLIGGVYYPDDTWLILVSYMVFILIIFSFISAYLWEENFIN